jgi:hypothetical protein
MQAASKCQRPEFAVGLRYEHSSDGVRSVSLLPERRRHFAKPSLHPIRLDVREVLTVHTRCALVGAALGVSMRQDVLAADLVVQGGNSPRHRTSAGWRADEALAALQRAEIEKWWPISGASGIKAD